MYIYTRALVNLIACNADICVHNSSEVVEECLELLLQLQRDGYPPNEGTLLIEKHARETLKAIEMEEAELKRAEAATSVLKNLQLREQSNTEDAMDCDDDHDRELPQISGSGAKSTSIIRGMFTDYYEQNGKDENAGKARKTGGCCILSHSFGQQMSSRTRIYSVLSHSLSSKAIVLWCCLVGFAGEAIIVLFVVVANAFESRRRAGSAPHAYADVRDRKREVGVTCLGH